MTITAELRARVAGIVQKGQELYFGLFERSWNSCGTVGLNKAKERAGQASRRGGKRRGYLQGEEVCFEVGDLGYLGRKRVWVRDESAVWITG
jgi:hypothetical protein